MSVLAKKLNVQSFKNSVENCVRNVWISKKMECPKLLELLRKLCTLYVRNVWVCKKSYIQNCVNSTVNCVHYICSKRLDLLKY